MIAQLLFQTATHLTNPFSTNQLPLKRTTGAHLNTLRTIFHADMEKTFSLSERPENRAENKTLNLQDLFPEGPVTDGILLLNRGQQECKSELIRLWGASGTPLDLCWIRLCKTHSSTPPNTMTVLYLWQTIRVSPVGFAPYHSLRVWAIYFHILSFH